MESTPDDILLLIFESYVHKLKGSPVLLLLVSRRWHLVALSTPSLWTRICPQILIPQFAGGTGEGGIWNVNRHSINRYLERSVPAGSADGLPLDIEIHSPLLSAEYLSRPCSCQIFISHENQLYNALCRLGESPYSRMRIPSFSTIMDLDRWRTLVVNLTESNCLTHGRYEYKITPLGFKQYETLLRLESLVLRNVTMWHAPIQAPALTNLQLHKTRMLNFRYENSLQSLYITYGVSQVTLPRWSLCTNLRTLMIDHWDTSTKLPFKELPNLSNVMINKQSYFTVFQELDEVFNDSRPLETLTLTLNSLPYDFDLQLRLCKKLRINLLRLQTQPVANDESTQGSGFAIRRFEINYTHSLLTEFNKRNTMIEPVDAKMAEILKIARSDELREQWLLDNARYTQPVRRVRQKAP